MLPNGWKLGDFGSIGKWTGGGTPSKANDSFWMGGTIPWVSPKDMTSGKICDTEDHITPEAIKNSATRLYPSGSVMIVTRSGILRKKLPVAIAESPVTVNQDLKVLPYDKQFSPEYVYNYILCFNSEILNVCAKDGTTVESIDTNSFLNFPVKLPPLPEQKKIAAILSTWDRAIEGTEKLLANSQQQKKALMQQLLTGKKRLPGFTGVWKIGALSEIAHIDTGFAFKSSEFTDNANDMPVVRMSDLKEGILYLESCKRLNLNSLSGLEKFSLKEKDFIFGMSGSLSNFAWVKKGNLPCYLNQRVGRIRAKKTGDQQFISYLYLSEKIQKEIEDKAAGAAQLNISLNDIRGMKIQTPPLPEQKAIAAVLSTADDEIMAIESDLSRLRQEKKALMQQLLTGKIRVAV